MTSRDLANNREYFRAACFSRCVVTHSQGGSNLHGHRPAIPSRQHPLWDLGMGQHSGSVNPLLEHSASPALLTNLGPQRHFVSAAGSCPRDCLSCIALLDVTTMIDADFSEVCTSPPPQPNAFHGMPSPSRVSCPLLHPHRLL